MEPGLNASFCPTGNVRLNDPSDAIGKRIRSRAPTETSILRGTDASAVATTRPEISRVSGTTTLRSRKSEPPTITDVGNAPGTAGYTSAAYVPGATCANSNVPSI